MGSLQEYYQDLKKLKCMQSSMLYFFAYFADLLKAMNHCADPCQDFFEYACGTWIKEHSIPESKSSWSQFRVLYERNELVMKDLILDNKEAREKYKDVGICYFLFFPLSTLGASVLNYKVRLD